MRLVLVLALAPGIGPVLGCGLMLGCGLVSQLGRGRGTAELQPVTGQCSAGQQRPRCSNGGMVYQQCCEVSHQGEFSKLRYTLLRWVSKTGSRLASKKQATTTRVPATSSAFLTALLQSLGACYVGKWWISCGWDFDLVDAVVTMGMQWSIPSPIVVAWV